MPEESIIAIVEENFDFDDENTQISESLHFQWTDSGTKNAYGASLNIGQVIIEERCSGWNFCSESGDPCTSTDEQIEIF